MCRLLVFYPSFLIALCKVRYTISPERLAPCKRARSAALGFSERRVALRPVFPLESGDDYRLRVAGDGQASKVSRVALYAASEGEVLATDEKVYRSFVF